MTRIFSMPCIVARAYGELEMQLPKTISKISLPLCISVVCQASIAQSQEPRPLEYVRICDSYGAQYYYSPGTETCINASTGQTLHETEDGTVVGETELAGRVSDIEERIAAAFADRPTFRDLAVVSALADPDLVSGERFGLRVNWGNVGSSNAVGISGAMVFQENVFGDRGRVSGTAAVAFTGGRVGGRAGVQLTW